MVYIIFKTNTHNQTNRKMKKKLAILSLIAIFAAATSLSAQTKPVAKTATTMPCCKGKTASDCKNMTPANKAKCKSQASKTCTKEAPVVKK